MEIVALDLEGVLVPEIWIAFSEKTGIEALKRTTRDEPDYHKLMDFRMDILRRNGLRLSDIQDVIAGIRPLDGAREFLDELRDMTQVVILSDTFTEFALPLMRQLGHPTIFCNSLSVDGDGMISGIRMRIENGKQRAVESFQSIGFRVFASALTSLSVDENNYISTADNRLLRRMVRDNFTRGITPEDTILRWKSVRAGEEKNIFPYQENADAMFNSALLFELPLLRYYAEPLLERIPPLSEAYSESVRLLKFLSYITPLTPDEIDCIPPTSVMREFIGGSSFEY